jgi:hypothetical protein
LSEILGPEDASVNHSVVNRIPWRQRERPSSAPMARGRTDASRGKGQKANEEGGEVRVERSGLLWLRVCAVRGRGQKANEE